MKPLLVKSSKGNNLKPAKFIAPGKLAKEHGHAQLSSRADGESSGKNATAHKSTSGTQKVYAEERESRYINNNRIFGGIESHNLILHFGEEIWKEKDFTEDCSLLDILDLCKKFIDIYSIGVKITDGDGRPIRNDRELLAVFKEHEDVENIEIYVYVDELAQPLPFKMPQDNPIFTASRPGIQNVTNGLTEQHIEDPDSQTTRSVRGKNKNKKLATLKRGQKLEIEFYNNRAVGENHRYWSRHLGKTVRNKHICPIQVKTWKEVTEFDKQHMWDAVKECFSNTNIDQYREHTLDHMSSLWGAWRSTLNAEYVKPCKTKTEVLKNVPPDMNDKDWEWLVLNKFLSEDFEKASIRNSNNRVNGAMPHRTGSKPHRQLIYEMGGKENNPPDIATILFETRQKGGKIVELEAKKKHDEIKETIKNNASLSHLEVVEACFKPQCHSHVLGFGGGIKRKHLNASHQAARIKELETKLHEKNEENVNLKGRIEGIESRLARIENDNPPISDVSPTPSNALDK